ncbi:MAG: hypothetical protein WCI97_10650 [Bacteroidota bacterium]
MKRIQIILTIAFLIFTFNLKAQDILIKTNGENLTVKVEKVSETVVEYKLFSNLDGPIYSINKTEVFQIKYQNGSIDNFNTSTKSQSTNTPTSNAPANIPPIFQSKYLTKNTFGIFIGGSIPGGNFAQSSISSLDGFANPGFSLAFIGNKNLVKYLGLGYTIGGDVNFFNTVKYQSLLGTSGNINFDTNPYYSYHVFLGPFFKIPIVDQVMIEFSPQMGMFGGILPGHVTSYTNSQDVLFKKDIFYAQNKIGFGYQMDIGFRINVHDGFAFKLGYLYIQNNSSFNPKYKTEIYSNGTSTEGRVTNPQAIEFKLNNPYLGFLFQF